jgi:hypothetical protein
LQQSNQKIILVTVKKGEEKRKPVVTMASRSDTELLTEHFGYPPVVRLTRNYNMTEEDSS